MGTGPFIPWHSYCEWKVSLNRHNKYEIVISRTFFDLNREQIEIDVINSLGDAVTYPDVDLKASAESIINVENGSSFVIRALNGPQNYTQATYQVSFRTVAEFSTAGVVIGSGSSGGDTEDSGGSNGEANGGDDSSGSNDSSGSDDSSGDD